MTAPVHETSIEAVPELPSVRIVRDFDAPPERVFHAWTDRDLVARWLGPDEIDLRIDLWDVRTGGAYRYTARQEGEEPVRFWGSFHEVKPPRRLVQTFGFDLQPEAVSLEIATFDDLGGRTRVTTLSLVDTLETRDAMLASGMEVGVVQGYAKLDTLLR